jgi:hypothetical protein
LIDIELLEEFASLSGPAPDPSAPVRFQLLDRRAFDVDDFRNYGMFTTWAAPRPPEPRETGWKDTVPAHPETVTRIIIPLKGYPDATCGIAIRWNTRRMK